RANPFGETRTKPPEPDMIPNILAPRILPEQSKRRVTNGRFMRKNNWFPVYLFMPRLPAIICAELILKNSCFQMRSLLPGPASGTTSLDWNSAFESGFGGFRAAWI